MIVLFGLCYIAFIVICLCYVFVISWDCLFIVVLCLLLVFCVGLGVLFAGFVFGV